MAGTIYVCVLVTAILGFIGSVATIVLHFYYPQYRLHFTKIVFWMTLCSLFVCLNYIVISIYEPNEVDDHGACVFHAWWMMFAETGLYSWNFAIGFYTWYFHIKFWGHSLPDRYGLEKLKKYTWLLHVIIWLWSTFASLFPLIFDGYGDAGLWCWIKEDPVWLRWVIWYGPLWFCFFVMIFFFVHIIYINYQVSKEEDFSFLEIQKSETAFQEKLRLYHDIITTTGFWYIFIYFVTWLFPSINRALEAADNNKYWVNVMHALTGERLVGLMSFFVYIYMIVKQKRSGKRGEREEKREKEEMDAVEVTKVTKETRSSGSMG